MPCEKTSLQSGTVGICEQNPHYYTYKGNPILLITSAEHYAAVINGDFDYISYFDKLHQYELNYTRIYTGAYYEVDGMFSVENPLAPALGSIILPWARSKEPGCFDGGNKFDLTSWDARYFQRLHDFINAAAARGIVVEICFFNAQYPQGWSSNPFYIANNIQGIGNYENYNDFQTTLHDEWYQLQKAYVRKIVEEVNGFDNVILEICDEPTTKGTPPVLAIEWVSGLVDVIIDTERALPKRHLIAQQLETELDFSADERVPVIVAQYLFQNDWRQIGGLEALDHEYGHNKPIELNETAYYPMWYEGNAIAASRVEAWEFMVGGGAGFNHLSSTFTVSNPAGDYEGNHDIFKSLQNLKHFLESFDFQMMYQDKNFVKSGVPESAIVRSISEPGRQYALYLHHSRLNKNNICYIVIPGDYSVSLEVDLPAGAFAVEWISPEKGEPVSKSILHHEGGSATLRSPVYALDIALSVKALTKLNCLF